MPSQTELSLHSLLPTVNFLPPELVELSNSLIAQSRSKAASLKAEEEVARTYVCCHVACERLGNKLALEIGKPRPPVKPRVYDKLKVYFNAVLKTRGPTTPRGRRTRDADDAAGESHGATSVRGSATKSPGATTSSASRKRTVTGDFKAGSMRTDNEIPKFVMPLIRSLCNEYDVSTAVPHVFAGVSSVFSEGMLERTPTAREKKKDGKATAETDDREQSIATWVTAIFAITYQRMSGEEILGKSRQRTELFRSAEHYCRQNAKRWDLGSSIEIAPLFYSAVNEQIREACNLEWYLNVPVEESLENAMQVDSNNYGEHTLSLRPSKTPLRRGEKHAPRPFEDINEPGAAGILPGLGTMFQPSIDWLSDERRDHYVLWKTQIMRQVRMLKKQRA